MTPALVYLIIAVALIGTELLIMQFSVFWFMFFGLGALLTSLICWFVPELSMASATTVFFFASLIVSAALYPILRKWQNQPGRVAGNDVIGQTATVTQSISVGRNGKVSWSGTDWPAQSAEGEDLMDVGETVKIFKLEGIRLIVGR